MERRSFSMLCAIQPIAAAKHAATRVRTRFEFDHAAAQQTNARIAVSPNLNHR
jgi:hypothetical protein